MKKLHQALCAMFFATSLMLAPAAHAAETTCLLGTDGDLTRNDNASATVNGVTLGGVAADDCFGRGAGSLGNDPLTIWGNMSLWAKDDIGQSSDVSNVIGGLKATIDAGAGGYDGTFTMGVTDVNGTAPLNLGAVLDLAFVLKAGTSWVAYLFEDVAISSSMTGTWNVEFNDFNDTYAEASHFAVYTRDGNVPAIPEPSTYALMAAGLLAIGWATRRQQRTQTAHA